MSDIQQAMKPFQTRVLEWMMACFSMEVCRDGRERNHRFLEESLELVQSLGCTASEAHQLVDYVFGRPAGEPRQELGGVIVTAAALCFPHGLDMADAGERELARVWTKIDQIRAKQAAKPKHSPLPIAVNSDAQDAARYRLMRDRNSPLEAHANDAGLSAYQILGGVRELKWGAELDSAIDAAIARQETAKVAAA